MFACLCKVERELCDHSLPGIWAAVTCSYMHVTEMYCFFSGNSSYLFIQIISIIRRSYYSSWTGFEKFKGTILRIKKGFLLADTTLIYKNVQVWGMPPIRTISTIWSCCCCALHKRNRSVMRVEVAANRATCTCCRTWCTWHSMSSTRMFFGSGILQNTII